MSNLALESDQSITKTAQELGINESTLYNWVSKFKPDKLKKGEERSDMTDELNALRRENSRLRQERDILKKAAVISTGLCNNFSKLISRRTVYQGLHR